MEAIAQMIWYAAWPVVIYLSVKFVQLNINHYKNMEELEEYNTQNKAAKN